MSNKRQNYGTDQAQILCGTSLDAREGFIPDKSLVGGKVPKCITSTTKDTIIIVYFIPIDKNIAKYKVYVNPARWYAGLKYILQLLL